MKSFWNQCKEAVKNRVNKSPYELWLEPTSIVHMDDKSITISVPNDFYIDRIQADYLPVLKDVVKGISKKDMEINIVSGIRATEAVSRDTVLKREKRSKPAGLTQHTGLNSKYTFDNFVVGPCNQFAHAAARAVAGGTVTYNPLFIYGGVGLGKTHLIQAIGNFILGKDNKRRLLYISSDVFVNDFITAIQHKKMTVFREKYRGIDVLFLDDIHFIAGKEHSQEELFYTFNALFESNKQIVLSSDKYPREIPKLEERLKSRFEWGLIADIQPPEFEMRIAILKQKGEENGIVLPQDVLEFIANKVRSNVRELEGCLSRLIAVSSIKGMEISLQMAEDSFRDIFRMRERVISINDIQREVAEYYNLKMTDLKSKRRERNIAVPRQIAMYLCKELTNLSLEDIGRNFGGKDHSTVIHSHRKIERLLRDDNNTLMAVKKIKKAMDI